MSKTPTQNSMEMSFYLQTQFQITMILSLNHMIERSSLVKPSAGVNEDPVTGSAHTSLIPYWSKRLNKTSLTAQQLSERGGGHLHD